MAGQQQKAEKKAEYPAPTSHYAKSPFQLGEVRMNTI